MELDFDLTFSLVNQQQAQPQIGTSGQKWVFCLKIS